MPMSPHLSLKMYGLFKKIYGLSRKPYTLLALRNPWTTDTCTVLHSSKCHLFRYQCGKVCRKIGVALFDTSEYFRTLNDSFPIHITICHTVIANHKKYSPDSKTSMGKKNDFHLPGLPNKFHKPNINWHNNNWKRIIKSSFVKCKIKKHFFHN